MLSDAPRAGSSFSATLTTRSLVLLMTANLAVCILPIEVMPHVYHYGYGVPFCNVSNAMRAVVFGTKNVVGLSFGVLIAWIAISFITMPLFLWAVHRPEAASTSVSGSVDEAEKVGTEVESETRGP